MHRCPKLKWLAELRQRVPRRISAMSDAPISFSRDQPETILPPVPPEWSQALDQARSGSPEGRLSAIQGVAARFPRYLEAWAELASLALQPAEGYAYARVGYHRGLDQLRAAGWRGTGYVRWRHATNRGFLRALDELRRWSEAIEEGDEAERCATFLRQLDPVGRPMEP